MAHHCNWVEPQSGPCGRSFKTNQQLETHMNGHTGRKPYACSIAGCGKSFMDASGRSKHENTHGSARFSCIYGCGDNFHRQDHLKRHVRWYWIKETQVWKEPACERLKPGHHRGHFETFDDRTGVPLSYPSFLGQLRAGNATQAAPGAQLVPNVAQAQGQQQQPPVPAPGQHDFGATVPLPQQTPVPDTGKQNLVQAPVVLQHPYQYDQDVWVGAPMKRNFGIDEDPAADFLFFDRAAFPVEGNIGTVNPAQRCIDPRLLSNNPPLASASSNSSLRSNQTNASSQGSSAVPQFVAPLPQEDEEEPFDVFDEDPAISGNDFLPAFLAEEYSDPTGRLRGY